MGSLLFPGPLVGGSLERSEIFELPAAERDSRQRREALLGERNLPEVRGQPGTHCWLVQRGKLKLPGQAHLHIKMCCHIYLHIQMCLKRILTCQVLEARDDYDLKHAASGSAILVGLWLTLHGSVCQLQRFPRALGIDVTPHGFHHFVKLRPWGNPRASKTKDSVGCDTHL